MKRTHRNALLDNDVTNEKLNELDANIEETVEKFITENAIELTAKEETIQNLQQIYYQHILMHCIDLDKDIKTYFMNILADFDEEKTAKSSFFFTVGLCYASKEYDNKDVDQDLMKITEHIKKQDMKSNHQDL